MPIRDSALTLFKASDSLVFAGTDTSGYSTSTAFEIDGTPLAGMALHFIPGTIGGASPEIEIIVRANSTSAATTTSTSPIIAHRSNITADEEIVVPFSTWKRTVLFDFVATGDTGYFSSPEAWITLDFNHDWKRTVEFY